MSKKVFLKRCDQCLFSRNRIVPRERAAEIVKECKRKKSHFICHKATIDGNEDIMCRGYYDAVWGADEVGKALTRMGLVEFVEHGKKSALPATDEKG
jgi:hypothetical protein